MFDDTIAAVATALGESGLSLVRLSGSEATLVADRMFRPPSATPVLPSQVPSHTVHFGWIVRKEKIVDEVLLTVMRAPRTFTREDVVEITCHGGILVAKLILDTALENGARMALPGEFTRRAFLNGRIDLAQAEAVADVIHARTELALDAANLQLAGKLSEQINRLRDDLITILAHVEAHIDFPDEDIAPDAATEMVSKLDATLKWIDRLLQTAGEGQLLRRGIRAAIIGEPNAGKSSLLNQLLGHERAIVSARPGTTRDTIEETANIRGVPVVFIDTAGLRDPTDEIEREGVRRSLEAAKHAELLLYVVDGSVPPPATRPIPENPQGRKRIFIINKVDLPVQVDLPKDVPQVDVSCLTGFGIDQLKDRIKELVWAGGVGGDMLEAMINSRHENALRRARVGIENSLAGFREGLAIELIAVDLHITVDTLGEIVGKTCTEDLLDAIFKEFCLGK